MAAGARLVAPEWVTASLEAGEWLPVPVPAAAAAATAAAPAGAAAACEGEGGGGGRAGRSAGRDFELGRAEGCAYAPYGAAAERARRWWAASAAGAGGGGGGGAGGGAAAAASRRPLEGAAVCVVALPGGASAGAAAAAAEAGHPAAPPPLLPRELQEHRAALQRLVRAMGGRVVAPKQAGVCVVAGGPAAPLPPGAEALLPLDLPAEAQVLCEEWLLLTAERYAPVRGEEADELRWGEAA